MEPTILDIPQVVLAMNDVSRTKISCWAFIFFHWVVLPDSLFSNNLSYLLLATKKATSLPEHEQCTTGSIQHYGVSFCWYSLASLS